MSLGGARKIRELGFFCVAFFFLPPPFFPFFLPFFCPFSLPFFPFFLSFFPPFAPFFPSPSFAPSPPFLPSFFPFLPVSPSFPPFLPSFSPFHPFSLSPPFFPFFLSPFPPPFPPFSPFPFPFPPILQEAQFLKDKSGIFKHKGRILNPPKPEFHSNSRLRGFAKPSPLFLYFFIPGQVREQEEKWEQEEIWDRLPGDRTCTQGWGQCGNKSRGHKKGEIRTGDTPR